MKNYITKKILEIINVNEEKIKLKYHQKMIWVIIVFNVLI